MIAKKRNKRFGCEPGIMGLTTTDSTGKGSFVIIMMALAFAFSCSSNSEEANSYPYRPITESELSAFIPEGYAINSSDIRETVKNTPLYTNMDADTENEAVLLLECDPKEEGKGAIVRILDFNGAQDRWELLAEQVLSKEQLGYDIKITDINQNGRNELHLSHFSYAINYFDTEPLVLELTYDNQLLSLFPDGPASEIGYEFDDKSQSYYGIDYIWAEGESHWGCHYFSVKVYKFNGSIFTLAEQKITSMKYGLDEIDSRIGGCQLYNWELILRDVKLR